MIENIKAVQNPLTVVAIFAGLAEVAGTVALATVDKELQHTFVWFVMAFPTFIVTLFFATLNFNAKVLYAPSDFRNEENFLNTLIGRKEMSLSFKHLAKQLDVAKQQIVAEAAKKIGAAGEAEREKLTFIVDQQIDLIKEKVESTRESAEDVTLEAALGQLPRSELQARVISFLTQQNQPIPIREIANAVKMSQAATERAVQKLATRGVVVLFEGDNGEPAALLNRSLEDADRQTI
jgi:biotin operon repressor